MSTATVVGAGVFGAATARELARRGWHVTLVEQYAPGTVRSASGGDTRLLRASHGSVDWYAESAWRARSAWLELQEETGTHIWEPVGLAWFAQRADGFEAVSRESLHRLGIPCEWLSPDDARDLYPSLNVDDLHAVLFEPEAGVLHARRATQLLVEDGERAGVRLQPGRMLPADEPRSDVVVWACGAWLPSIFPGLVEIRVTKQDVFHFGNEASWSCPPVPGWVDYDAAVYGTGDLDGHGVKVAPDREGPLFDPDADPRVASAVNEKLAREYIATRFPGLGGAPLVGTRTCPYALTQDTHFLIAPHPEQERVWLLGGGSGHGFKHGPALGEYVRDLLEGTAEPDPRFALGKRQPAMSLRTAGGRAV